MVDMPARTSSKRKGKDIDEEDLEEEMDNINKEIQWSQCMLKPRALLWAARRYSSSSSPYFFTVVSPAFLCHMRYWNQAADLSRQLQEVNEIGRKISLRDFLSSGGKEAEWLNSTTAIQLFDQLRAEQANERIYERQADRLTIEAGLTKKTLRRAFTKLFTTSKLGLGITFTGARKPKGDNRNEFRKSLIAAHDAKHPEHDSLWCPIRKDWCSAVSTKAVHFFPSMHGQEVMDAIFGPTASKELFSPLNGIIVSAGINYLFNKGFMVIVPRISDNPSAAEVSLWNQSNPKEYKIRILGRDSITYNQTIAPYSPRKWKDLDGTNVEFRNDFRPRARYVYFHYCVQMLRYAWREQRHGQSLKKQLEKSYWGTPGRYLPRNMLMALVEEMGHEYEKLLEGATDDEAPDMDEDSEILLATATAQIKAWSPEEIWEDEESDDDDDDEDIYEGDDDEDI